MVRILELYMNPSLYYTMGFCVSLCLAINGSFVGRSLEWQITLATNINNSLSKTLEKALGKLFEKIENENKKKVTESAENLFIGRSHLQNAPTTDDEKGHEGDTEEKEIKKTPIKKK